MGANCALDFFPSSFSTGGDTLMGLQSANEGLLTGFFRHADVESFVCHTRTADEAKAFERMARSGGRNLPVERVEPGDNAALSRTGALLHPFPGFGPLAWVRRFGDPRGYSLLGITHTTATAAVMDSIGNLSIAPIEPWDAVVCTSTAVRNTYEQVLAEWRRHVEERLGATRTPLPMLPIIPLGVDCAKFAPPDGERTRALWRRRYGVADDDLVALWVGRLNHLSKAHPLPSYLALEAVARAQPERRVFFFQAGHFQSKEMGEAFRAGAREFAPSVRAVFLDGREPAVRREVWSAADVFLSLSDNIQETFGLTPIEAMAAGLPVVATDWDGYRDTVRDGVDGIMIPTAAPAAGAGVEIARAFASGALSYNAYAGVTCQTISADLRRATDALGALANDAGLRARFGAAGRRRAAEAFDWRVIIARYQALLAELAGIRAAAPAPAPLGNRQPHPLRGDPYAVFSGYPTRAITGATQLAPGPFAGAIDVEALLASPLNSFARGWRCADAEVVELARRAAAAERISVEALIGAPAADADPEASAMRLRGVAWLVKMGALAIVEE